MYDSISLFSGAMGLDLGLEKSGINIKICQDYDKTCYETMLANGKNALLGDIREITSDTLLRLSGLLNKEVFLVCGGPPCQPFSTAGRRMGINDPRGSLFMDYIRIVNEIRPRFFIFENVKGLVSIPIDVGGNQGEVLNVILEEFEKIGYKIIYKVLDAVHYGVPQFRERLIIIGSRDNEDIFFPIPTHFQKHQNRQMQWTILKDAIYGLENDENECMSFSDERLKYLKMVPEGGNWRDLPQEYVASAMGGAYKSGGGKVGFYRRLTYSQPSPTLVTSPVQKATMMCHPIKNRPLSVKEYARIQQFPDTWKVKGTITNKYKQIGNAVPIGLATAIGEAIIATATGNSFIATKRTRGTSVHKDTTT